MITIIETTIFPQLESVFQPRELQGCGPKIEATIKDQTIEVFVFDDGYTYRLEGNRLVITSYEDCAMRDSLLILPLQSMTINLKKYILSLFVYGKLTTKDKCDFEDRLLLTPFRNFLSSLN